MSVASFHTISAEPSDAILEKPRAAKNQNAGILAKHAKYARNMQDARRERKQVKTPQKRQKIRRGETDWGAAGRAEKIRQGGT